MQHPLEWVPGPEKTGGLSGTRCSSERNGCEYVEEFSGYPLLGFVQWVMRTTHTRLAGTRADPLPQ
jgi:hypothetical protein